ncbi:MAG: CPBP family intramembrane metalloprotease [Bacteroidetes bacterium]|nr:CPBP family intramembrane metalloprotease [Bacteroidota bacterium]
MRNGYFGIPRLILLVAAAVGVFNVLGGVVLVALYGLNVQNADASVMVIVNAVSELLVMLAIPILLTRTTRKDPHAVFRIEGMHETPLGAQLIGVPVIIATEVVGGGLDGLWHSFLKLFPSLFDTLVGLQKQLDDLMSNVTTAHSSGELIILLIGISAVPAIAEEAFFRGFIQTHIERSGKGRPRPIVALVITSLLFGAMHMSPLNLPGLVAMGAALGWLAYRTSDLRVSMLAHAMNNGLIVLATFYFQGSALTSESLAKTPDVPLADSAALIGLGLPFLFAMLFVFQRITAPLTARGNAAREIDALNRETFSPIYHDVTQ